MKSTEDRRQRLLAQLGQQIPLIAASLSHVQRTDKQGRIKDYHILTFKQDGKTRSVYVPKEMLREVRVWIQNYRRLKQLMADISTLSVDIIRRHVPEKRAAAAKSPGKANARSASPSPD
jgi:hypothetical protein